MQERVIVIQHKDDRNKIQVWTSLTKLTKKYKDFRYSYLKKKKLDEPFKYKDWYFWRVKINSDKMPVREPIRRGKSTKSKCSFQRVKTKPNNNGTT